MPITTFTLVDSETFTIDQINDTRSLLFTEVDFRPTISIVNSTTISINAADIEVFVAGTFFNIDGIPDRFKIDSVNVGLNQATISSTNNRTLSETGSYDASYFSSAFKLKNLLQNEFRSDMTPENASVSTFDLYPNLTTSGVTPSSDNIPSTTQSLYVELTFRNEVEREYEYYFQEEINKIKSEFRENGKLICYITGDLLVHDVDALRDSNETEYGRLLSSLFIHYSCPINQITFLGKILESLGETVFDSNLDTVLDELIEAAGRVEFVPKVRIAIQEGLKILKDYSNVIRYIEDFKNLSIQLIQSIKADALGTNDYPTKIVSKKTETLLEEQIRYAARLIWLKNISLSSLNEEYVFQQYNLFMDFTEKFENFINQVNFFTEVIDTSLYMDALFQEFGSEDVPGLTGSPFYSEIQIFSTQGREFLDTSTTSAEQPEDYLINDKRFLGLDQDSTPSYVDISLSTLRIEREFPPFVPSEESFPRFENSEYYRESIPSIEFKPVLDTDILNVKTTLCAKYPLVAGCQYDRPVTYSIYRRADSDLGTLGYAINPEYNVGSINCGINNNESIFCTKDDISDQSSTISLI